MGQHWFPNEYQDVTLLPSQASSYTTFPKTVGQVEAPCPPHVHTTCPHHMSQDLCLGINKGMLFVKYFCCNKSRLLWQSYFVKIIGLPHVRCIRPTSDRRTSPTVQPQDITDSTTSGYYRQYNLRISLTEQPQDITNNKISGYH